MKNDAKLGMLAGVLGVIVAAVLFANTPPPAPLSLTNPASEPKAKGNLPPDAAQPSASATDVPMPTSTKPLPSTPVARPRKETSAQPVSRSGGSEEEP